MAPNLLWVVDLTYINLIRRHRAALTRDHTGAALQCASQEYFALLKSAALTPRLAAPIAYDNALRETSIGTLK
jgi:hypothetical protein